ncbi:MAG: ABC transporter ATP-binding protein [Planctomycetota bacterium]
MTELEPPTATHADPSAAQQAPQLLKARGLVKRLRSGDRELTVLNGVDFDVRAGEVVAILGPSGSGKSTLLGLLAGLDRPSEGEVALDGAELNQLDEDGLALLRRRLVGFVFQSFQLLANLTARENVLLPLELTGVPDAPERADALLLAVGLAERSHHYPSQLSGGEQQRVALARAFAPRPRLLFADEPTGNLDGATGEKVLALMLALQREHGTALVIVTHDLEVASCADRRVHLRDGRVISIEHGARAQGRHDGLEVLEPSPATDAAGALGSAGLPGTP